MATIVYLGNRAAITPGAGSEPLRGEKLCTTVYPPDCDSLSETFREITGEGGVWSAHSAAPPAWVAVDSDNPKAAYALAELLSSHYGCEIRTPDPQEA